MPDSPALTIFIPTYNRAGLLERALASVEQQDFRDFDVVIVDDGSTDDTAEVVRAWQERSSFPIEYVRQENQGKHVAHNTALKHIRGELTVILDSDDALAPNALDILQRQWRAIPEAQRSTYAGIEGLCADLATGEIIGSAYPMESADSGHLDSNYIDVREQLNVTGDKAGALVTDVLRAYPFPDFPGEPFCPESLVWRRIALRYQTRYINQVIEQKEYLHDGLTAGLRRLRLRSPQGMRLLYLEEWQLLESGRIRGHGVKARFRVLERYARYCGIAGIGFWQQRAEVRNILHPLCFVAGVLHQLSDHRRIS